MRSGRLPRLATSTTATPSRTWTRQRVLCVKRVSALYRADSDQAQMSKGDASLRESWSQVTGRRGRERKVLMDVQRGQDPQLPAGKAFRYRKFELDDDMTLVVRCEVRSLQRQRESEMRFLMRCTDRLMP
eukprot:766595-Hanusia_phi.AAC.6